METKRQNSKETAKSTAGIVSYIGPNIPKLGLTQYQVYKGGIPDFHGATDEQNAMLVKLFVPISRLSIAMAEIEKQGTAYNKFYNDGLIVRKELN